MYASAKFVDLTKLRKNKFTWKYIKEKLPFHDIKVDDFVEICSLTKGFRPIGPGRQYNIRENPDNVDQWVKEAMWHYDPEYYDELRGYTKSARLTATLFSLLNYCGPIKYRDFDDEFESIYWRKMHWWRDNFNKVDILSIEAALRKVPTDGAAGYNFPGKKKGEVLPQAGKYVRNAMHVLRSGRTLEQIPYKLGLRGHLSPVEKLKSRAVWMGAVETNVMENMLFRGFYDQLFNGLHFQSRVMTGKDSMKRLHEFLELDPEYTFANTDASGWDTMRCRFLLYDIFDHVLRPNINFQSPEEEALFDHLKHDFVHSCLALPNGVVLQKDCGVPSGSFLTLLVNSIGNDVFMGSVMEYIGVNVYHPKVLGDDFGFLTDRMEERHFDEFAFDIAQTAMRFFGLVVKPEKLIITNDLESRKFIGYQLRAGKLFREDGDLMRGVLYPESEVKSLAVSFTRVFAFYVIGGCGSNRFNAFYERYLSGYYEELLKYGEDLFALNVLRAGNLRVFKHLYHFDLEVFAEFNIDTFRGIFQTKVPFALTLGADFLTGF